MKKLSLVVVIALSMFMLPAAAQAKGGEHKSPVKQCKALGKKMGAQGFAGRKAERRLARCQRKLHKAQLRSAKRACRAEGKRGPALKRCVKAKLAGESSPNTEELKNAAKECKALRDEDPEEFTDEYGESPNAFGKCVVDHVDDESDDPEASEGDDDSGEVADEPDEPEEPGDEPDPGV